MSDELQVVEPTEEEILFAKIKSNYRIDDDRFKLGTEFAFMCAEGTLSATKAYEQVFNVDFDTARRKASKMKHAKWIQELIRYYQFDDGLEYTKETKDAISVLHKIVMDPKASNREKTDASKALREYIKAEQVQSQQKEEETVSKTLNAIGDLVKGIAQLSGQGKMVSSQGTIVDVPLLD